MVSPEEAIAGPAGPIAKTERVRMLRTMLLIRRFEERAAEMYQRGKIRGFLHLCIGEEACAVGSISPLGPGDAIVTHYRDHGHALARGLDPGRVMAELFGRAGGVCGGRGGSMHLFDAAKGFLGGYAIVAGHLPLACGLGLAARHLGQDRVVLCIFGDGGVNEGEFHESLNLAQIWKLPVVFFCENNLYGMGVRLSQSLSVPIASLAGAYGMPSNEVDGMDVLAVRRATERALDHTRSGAGPVFLEAKTYRFRGHSMADPEYYRTREEVEEWKKKDPIERLGRRLEEGGVLDADEIGRLGAEAEAEVARAIRFAEESPEPALSTLFDHVLKE